MDRVVLIECRNRVNGALNLGGLFFGSWRLSLVDRLGEMGIETLEYGLPLFPLFPKIGQCLRQRRDLRDITDQLVRLSSIWVDAWGEHVLGGVPVTSFISKLEDRMLVFSFLPK